MTTRLLPPEEWSRLEVVPVPQVAPHIPPGDVRVVAVESDGALAACVTLYRATHWEGTWIAPEHRNAGVTRALLSGIREAAASLGSTWAFVGSDAPRTAAMLKRLGGVQVPMETYLVPFGGVGCRQQ